MSHQDSTDAPAPTRVLALLPLIIVIALSLLFLLRLGAGDSSKLPSTLIGNPAPNITLPGLNDQPGLDNADLRQGHVTIINVFASWCEPCRAEHPFLMSLSKDPDLIKQGVTMVGMANKDGQKTVKQFLDTLGNPYSKIGFDINNRAGIDWGVYGIPETFVVRGDGVVSYKFVGPMDEKSIATLIKPEIQKAIKASAKN